MLINFVSSAKASIYSFVNDQLIFLKCEQNNTNTSVIKEDFNDCLFFLICDWAKMLWGHIISFVIIQNQTLSFDCHSTRNLSGAELFDVMTRRLMDALFANRSQSSPEIKSIRFCLVVVEYRHMFFGGNSLFSERWGDLRKAPTLASLVSDLMLSGM